ncbi:undecaprenyl/decaprenyl-phosphate alpha-N-acetylglucosaminyl 1-phosphate transferase [candidate division KSB1 bacterium]|nr:undecaprenyl/decaprenyl-phosphate alpha-N-acetylglucosaminyl 1-phosphate transferase [candidate division KSB1 bacterium]
MRWFLYLIVFVETTLISWILVPQIIRLARKSGVVDQPGDRKVHHETKPLLGGVAIFTSFISVIGLNLAVYLILFQLGWIQSNLPALSSFHVRLAGVWPQLLIVLLGGLGIHLLGLVDDIFKGKLTYKSKFPIQILIVLLVALFGVRVEFMPGKLLDVIVTTIWIVGIANSFNLLDNMDGLTAGVAIISAGILFILAVIQGQVFFALLLAGLAGACLGFLRYNFNPSKLFMGDSGSLFIGYLFGALTTTGSYVVDRSQSMLPILIPVLVLSIPLFDTFSVMFIRWREGRPLFIGDKRHFSHRLVEIGLSHRQAVIFIYVLGLCVGVMALLLPYAPVVASWIIVLQAILIYSLITILIMIGKKNKQCR